MWHTGPQPTTTHIGRGKPGQCRRQGAMTALHSPPPPSMRAAGAGRPVRYLVRAGRRRICLPPPPPFFGGGSRGAILARLPATGPPDPVIPHTRRASGRGTPAPLCGTAPALQTSFGTLSRAPPIRQPRFLRVTLTIKHVFYVGFAVKAPASTRSAKNDLIMPGGKTNRLWKKRMIADMRRGRVQGGSVANSVVPTHHRPNPHRQ